jgi:hypothetical protein
MILGYLEQYADGTSAIALASNAGTDTTILDHGVAAWNGGAGTPVWVIVSIATTFSGAASNPVYATWGTATASGGTYQTHIRGRTFTIGEMTKGTYLLAVPIPAGVTINRFSKVTMTLDGGVSLTAGAFDAYLTLNAPRF